MKDVTVALELTLPKEVSDQQIKFFVENAVKQYLLNERTRYREEHGAPKIDYSWESLPEPFNVLGVCEHMIDVTGIANGSHWMTPGGIALEAWRMFDAGGFLMDSGDDRQTV